MRVIVIYLMFGLASASVDHALNYDTLTFWRDVVAWPLVSLSRVVDLHWLLTQRGQDYISLCFAAALIIYAGARFEWPSARREREARSRRAAL